MKDETEKLQTEVHWNKLNTFTENNNTIKFYTGDNLTEVMRLDKDGMIYKGNRIEDAGEAHRAFLDVMNDISWKKVHELREANQQLEEQSKFDRDRIRILSRKCTAYDDEIKEAISILNRGEELFAAQRKDRIRELEAEVKRLREASPETDRECECFSPSYLIGHGPDGNGHYGYGKGHLSKGE
uniref:Uncharacterized protein n=1 Tax=viral metagenome TaxID=1070528 RepID=A0A6M3L5J8_9ZZZZ